MPENRSYKRIKQPFPEANRCAPPHSDNSSRFRSSSSISHRSDCNLSTGATLRAKQNKHQESPGLDLVPYSRLQRHSDTAGGKRNGSVQSLKADIGIHSISNGSLTTCSSTAITDARAVANPAGQDSEALTKHNSNKQDSDMQNRNADIPGPLTDRSEIRETSCEAPLESRYQASLIDPPATYYTILHAGEIFREIEQNYHQLQSQISEKEAELQQSAFEKTEYKQRLKNSEMEKKKIISTLHEQAKIIHEFNKKIQEFETEKIQLQKENTDLASVNSKAIQDLQLSEDERALLLDESAKVKKRWEQLKDHMDEVTLSQKGLREDSLKLQENFSTVIRDLMNSIASRDDQIRNFEGEINSRTMQLKHTESEVSRCTSKPS